MLFLNILGLEIMSDDNLVKKKKTSRPRRYKQPILNSRHIESFPTGLTHNFGQKMEILSLFVYGQNRR